MDKEELEKNVDYYAKRAKSAESHIIRQNERIADLEKEIAELKEQNTNLQEMLKTERSVTCKEEYLKKVTELEKENEELKKQLRDKKCNDKDCPVFITLVQAIKERAETLTKAKELLLELYDCIPSSMADSCIETLQKVALFFKDSEVEK